MKDKIKQSFINYIPANELIEILEIKQSELILSAMRKQVKLYYPNKSVKHLTYYPANKVGNSFKAFMILLITFFLPIWGVERRSYATGEILQIKGSYNLNALGTNTLSESLLFSYCHSTDTILLRHEKLINKFHFIQFKDILVDWDEAIELRKILFQEDKEIAEELAESAGQTSPFRLKTKQSQREKIFLNWLQDKDESHVSDMKKEDVWKELQQLNLRLFSVEPKNFFRDQKIITFKSGRKTS
jgi:hypothetical protein